MQLNLEDPFEAAVAEIVELNRRKRADYALDGDPWSNFRQTAERISARGHDFDPVESVVMNIEQKMVRLASLRKNKRGPQNEAVSDTWKDISVYGLIGYILSQESEQSDPDDFDPNEEAKVFYPPQFGSRFRLDPHLGVG